jgi:hypothetical protein
LVATIGEGGILVVPVGARPWSQCEHGLHRHRGRFSSQWQQLNTAAQVVIGRASRSRMTCMWWRSSFWWRRSERVGFWSCPSERARMGRGWPCTHSRPWSQCEHGLHRHRGRFSSQWQQLNTAAQVVIGNDMTCQRRRKSKLESVPCKIRRKTPLPISPISNFMSLWQQLNTAAQVVIGNDMKFDIGDIGNGVFRRILHGCQYRQYQISCHSLSQPGRLCSIVAIGSRSALGVGLHHMQVILDRLARREDIPDDWWAAAGLARTLDRGLRSERVGFWSCPSERARTLAGMIVGIGTGGWLLIVESPPK